MAKDRFSKFKKSFYSNEFRYGNDMLFEKNKLYKIQRPKLSKDEMNRLKKLLKNKLTEWESSFVKNVIRSDKSLTLKQKDVIINLEKKYK
jgi:hypothetical protein